MVLRILALIAVVLYLSACSENEHEAAESPTAESLKVTSYNMGLALNFVSYTDERLVVNEALLADYDSDVICFQEVWLEDQVDAIKQALSSDYANIYTVQPEQIFSDTAACTNEEIAGLESCAIKNCSDLTGKPLVDCTLGSCIPQLFLLPDKCLEGVMASIGIPDITIEILIEAVTQPGGIFAYEGSLGLMLASKYELQNREFQDFIDDSSGNHRGALYADVVLDDQTHVVGCTHPTANLFPLKYTGKHGSWEGENHFMQQEMITFVNHKAGNSPIFFGGDFNCSIANASNGVDEDFAASCQLWLDDGFVDPAADQSPCTYCANENLILIDAGSSGSWLLDHVFVKNLATADEIRVERVFHDPVAIESTIPPTELKPEDSPKMTHPSDHFGIELEIELP